jgi:hypothetical protein
MKARNTFVFVSVMQDLLSVWGGGVSDVWAVGRGGLILHYH